MQWEQEVSDRHAELQALQSKRQRILDFRHLVQAFVQRKLLGPEQDVMLESQRLHGGVEREGLILGVPDPVIPHLQVPAHELSIHRLDWTALAQHRAFLTVCQASGFPLYKALEHPLPHMAELKKELLALCAQLGYKNWALASLQQHQGSPGTNAQALVQALQDHDREQAGALGLQIQLVTEQCRQLVERWPEVQAAINAWWEQVGQFVLPAEHRLGWSSGPWPSGPSCSSSTAGPDGPILPGRGWGAPPPKGCSCR
nr:uncharacterized protein LOC116818446 [Chelonoidis abingdonii]